MFLSRPPAPFTDFAETRVSPPGSDSEFPFLLGVVFANASDKPKLIEQIRKMPVYATSGGVGGEITYAMNIVPYQAFPPEAAQRIYRRMTLREAVLHEKIAR
jgi:hypothetical protein